MRERIAVEITQAEALGILRARQMKIGRRASRYHKGAMWENTARKDALKGICGDCARIVRERIVCPDGSPGVRLRCRANQDPLGLYLNRELGETPDCAYRLKEI